MSDFSENIFALFSRMGLYHFCNSMAIVCDGSLLSRLSRDADHYNLILV